MKGAWLLAALLLPASAAAELVVGSKSFTESVVLGEILAGTLQGAGFEARHQAELGGTRVLWSALLAGEIDAYVEYTGTLDAELLDPRPADAGARAAAVRAQGLQIVADLGFQNTYAIGMRAERADALGLERLSQLSSHPELSLGFSNEFLDRADGWPALRDTYGLGAHPVTGLEHALAYRGLAAGSIDATDLYSTDAEIAFYDLRVLEDDRGLFPEYRAVVVARADLPPGARDALATLAGALDEAAMVRLNEAAKLDRVPAREVAAGFLAGRGVEVQSVESSRSRLLLRSTAEHLGLVAVSMALALVLALPLGIAAARRPRLGAVVLGAVGVLQTIPSLALLVMLIPLLGIGGPPAIAALFVYSLLPIVRNTHAGLTDIPPALRESAIALGLPPAVRLRRVELPLARPTILAGIKTAVVINIGTATLGALVGAGGYGQPILTGIRLDDTGLILLGAVPAATLALLAQAGLSLLERRWG